jgi:Zn-finger nucleic acid-binding protein
MWFDWFELEKLDERNEGLGKAVGEALAQPQASGEHRGKIDCPKCGVPMYAHRYKKAAHAMVDECINCGGFFLDGGELKTIRDTFMSKEEEQKQMDDLLAGVPNYKRRKKELEHREVRNNASIRLVRFLGTNLFESLL